MTFDPRHQSRALVDGADRAAARSYFKAIGFTDEDLKLPLVGVATCWIESTPCNWNHRKLAEKVKEGIRAAGGTPIEFNSISVTDGVSMGTEGTKASLVSRETIADSVELVVRGHLLDGFVGISGCDKTIPAMVMAMARLNLPSVMLYGGSIAFGEYKGRRLTIQEVFEAIGAFNAGKIDARELNEIESRACPGAGACGGQFTANTMSTAFEMLGVSPMGFNGVTAVDPRKEEVAFETGKLVMEILTKGLLPRQIITRKALHNAIAGVMATGGSTNAVLHLLAIAKEAGVKLAIDEFDQISRKTPLLAALRPRGMRGQDLGREAGFPSRPGPRVRARGRLVRGCEGGEDQAQRRDRHPLGGPQGRAGHARDAARDGRAPGRRPRRHRRADDRRALLRGDPRLHDRPHRARGRRGRPDRGAPERRHDRDRHQEAQAQRRALGRRDQEASQERQAAQAALHVGRAGQVRAARFQRIRWRRHRLSLDRAIRARSSARRFSSVSRPSRSAS